MSMTQSTAGAGGGDEVEAAARAYIDGMAGDIETQWLHKGGWDEEQPAFREKVRKNMALALEAAALASAPPAGQGNGDAEKPCHWGGGNDIIWCSTCGAEYAYAKGETRPDCPRASAPLAPTPDAGSDLDAIINQSLADHPVITATLHRSDTASPPPGEDLAGQGEPVANLRERLGQPHCWVLPGQDTANCYGYIDAHCCEEGELSKPLWSLESIRDAIAAPAPSRPADREEIDINALANAIAAADHGYDIRLTSLNEEGRVYTLDTRDSAPVLQFADIEDAQEHASRHRSLARAKAAAAFLALRDAPRNGGDGCEFCGGQKGGVPGNENVLNGITTCDYCTVLVHRASPPSPNAGDGTQTPTHPDREGKGGER